MDSYFIELSSVLALATLLGLLCHYLKQPLFFAYLLTGMVIGIVSHGQAVSPQTLHFFGELGIALLLFLVGLELSITDIKKLGKVITITAAGQIAVTVAIGWLVALGLGFKALPAVYIALALTFTSTIIAVKWLNDARATQSLHGRLALGLLLTQDMVALAAFIILSSLGRAGGQFGLLEVTLTLSKGATLLLGNILVSRYVVPYLFRWLAGSSELLFLGSIGWCVLLATIAQSAGFSIEIGAFLAGLSLSSSSYQFQIAARIKPLRDFFVTLFFIVLGLQLSLNSIFSVLIPSLIFAAVVIFINPSVIGFLLGRLGYKRHTAFFTSIVFGQVGEFSLVIASLGLSLGQLSNDGATLITLVVLVTILIASYLNKHQEMVYRHIKPFIGWIENEKGASGGRRQRAWQDHVVLLGCHRLGYDFLTTLRRLHAKIVVIEFDPEQIEQLDQENIATIFGDATDEEVLAEAALDKATLVVSTIENHTATIRLLQHRQQLASQATYIVTAASVEHALIYYRLGADYVIIPLLLGGSAVADLVARHWQNLKSFEQTRLTHLQSLTVRELMQQGS